MQRIGNDILSGDKPRQHPLGRPAEQIPHAPTKAAAHHNAALRQTGAQALLRLQQPADQRQPQRKDRRDQQITEGRCHPQHQQRKTEGIAAAGLCQHPDTARVAKSKAGKILHLMRHPEHRDQKLADGKPEAGPQPAAAAQQPQHGSQQRQQHSILHDAHTGDRCDQQQRPQPDQVAVPVPRVGEGHQRGRIGALRACAPVLFYVPLQVLGQCFKVIDIVGRVRHHGRQRRGLIGGGRLKQHDGVGVVVHLEQLKAEVFRIQPFLGDRLCGSIHMVAHRPAGQGIRRQQQRKQHRQCSCKGPQRPQGKGRLLVLRVRHTAPLSHKNAV